MTVPHSELSELVLAFLDQRSFRSVRALTSVCSLQLFRRTAPSPSIINENRRKLLPFVPDIFKSEMPKMPVGVFYRRIIVGRKRDF